MLKPRLLKKAEISELQVKKETARPRRRQPHTVSLAGQTHQSGTPAGTPAGAPALSSNQAAPRAKAGAQTYRRQGATQRITNPRAAFAALFKQAN